MLGKFITDCEDSLTAAVFTHLLHLPSEVFWQILRNACYTSSLPEDAGEPRSVEFWPKWDPEGTDNNIYVEPDVFIRFANFDLLIEAKRWNDDMQDSGQWERELIAYTNEYGYEKRPVKMIAVGGIHTNQDDALTHNWRSLSSGDPHLFICPVHMCRWSSLLLECQRMERELGRLKYQSSQTRAQERILADLIELCAWLGFVTVRWFDYSVFKAHLLGPSIDSNQQLLRRINLQFRVP
jgi:hypothetical protein